MNDLIDLIEENARLRRRVLDLEILASGRRGDIEALGELLSRSKAEVAELRETVKKQEKEIDRLQWAIDDPSAYWSSKAYEGEGDRK